MKERERTERPRWYRLHLISLPICWCRNHTTSRLAVLLSEDSFVTGPAVINTHCPRSQFFLPVALRIFSSARTLQISGLSAQDLTVTLVSFVFQLNTHWVEGRTAIWYVASWHWSCRACIGGANPGPGRRWAPRRSPARTAVRPPERRERGAQ